MVSSIIQVVIGFTGFVGFFLRFIGPITIAPTIALIGLSLVDVCLANAGKCFFNRTGVQQYGGKLEKSLHAKCS